MLLLTAPHPATRCAVAFLERVFIAGGRRIAFERITDADRALDTGVPAIHLRPGAADALGLAVTADPDGRSGLRAACALLAHLDDRWHGVPRLSLESVVDRPQEAVRLVSRRLGLDPAETLLAAADALVASLRDEVTPFLHVLPFLAAVEPEKPDIAWIDGGLSAPDGLADMLASVPTGVPRHMLVVAGPGAAVDAGPVAPVVGWRQHRIAPGDPLPEEPGADGTLGLAFFDGIHGMVLDDLLDRVMGRLAPGGMLCGRERNDTTVEAAVAQLTKAGDRHQLVFTLSGTLWRAVAPAWWR
jgi:hypothetical protein